MKPLGNRLIVSALGGVAVLCLGICLMVFPLLAAGNANPHGVAEIVVTAGMFISFAVVDAVTGIPFVGFPLAFVFWSSLIFGIWSVLKAR
jgi:hypothetical protein